MLTFNEAMLITHTEVGPTWEPGTLYVRPKGREDNRSYAVFYGPKEWIVDRDPNFLVGDIPVAFVDKETGEVTLEAYLWVIDRLDHMTPVEQEAE